MRQFFAILKDSFREAVDGFVIYVMLGLTAVLLLIALSLSFTPVPAEGVVPDLVKRFPVYIPDRGQAQPVAMALGVSYSASDIKTDGSTVSFRLTAKGDGFRREVAGWLKPAGESVKAKDVFGPQPKRGKGQEKRDDTPVEIGLEYIPDQGVTAADAAAVTDEQMASFIANQFVTHAGITGVSVKLAAGSTEPQFDFEVTATGATAARGWPQEVALFFGGWKMGKSPLGVALNVIEDRIVNGLGAGIALIIGIVITAFFIPNMLRKGALDLLIAKPIGRGQLLVYKYIGGLTFVFLLSVAAVGGVWLIIGLRSGHWDPHFLLVIPLLTFTFAVLYAVSALAAVLTRSAIAAILITLTFAFILYSVGTMKTIADVERNVGSTGLGQWPQWLYNTVDTLNDVLPRYKDLDKLTSHVIDLGSLSPLEQRVKAGILDYPSGASAVGVSLAYIVVFLALAVWRFKKRDS